MTQGVPPSRSDAASAKHHVVPYPCLFIDASWIDAFSAIHYLRESDEQRDQITADIRRIWSQNGAARTPNEFLPCLSVRSAFDLFLRLKNYPPGSEIIMTAINIPQMMHVAQHHGLKVVPLDIRIKTLAPRIQALESLITENTVAVLLAHIYGRWSNIDDAVRLCRRHNLAVLEDCAEAFCGFKKLGHPDADLSFFSFGAIKPSTAFGGAVVRMKDLILSHQMQELQKLYPIQGRMAYAKKVLSCALGMVALNTPNAMRVCLPVFRSLGFDHKEAVINLLRGFSSDLISTIRRQPSTALLRMMSRRFQSFDEDVFQEGMKKCDYVRQRLPQNIGVFGSSVDTRNYWLFPVIVSDPGRVLQALNSRGIDAYRGATQLTCLRPRPSHAHSAMPLQAWEAQYLIDHVIYLPVHKHVPYRYLDEICVRFRDVLKTLTPCPSKEKNVDNGKDAPNEYSKMKIYCKL